MERTQGLRLNNHYLYKKGNKYFYSKEVTSMDDFLKKDPTKYIDVTDEILPLIDDHGDEHVNYITGVKKGGSDQTRTIEIHSVRNSHSGG